MDPMNPSDGPRFNVVKQLPHIATAGVLVVRTPGQDAGKSLRLHGSRYHQGRPKKPLRRQPERGRVLGFLKGSKWQQSQGEGHSGGQDDPDGTAEVRQGQQALGLLPASTP
jgi:hypothetical protein